MRRACNVERRESKRQGSAPREALPAAFARIGDMARLLRHAGRTGAYKLATSSVSVRTATPVAPFGK